LLDEIKSDVDIENELSQDYMGVERRCVWKECSRDGKSYLIPDTTAALGHDVFGLSLFSVKDTNPDLLVWAYPAKHRDNPALAEMFSKRMQLRDVPADWLICIGRIVNGKVYKLDEKIIDISTESEVKK